MKIKQCEGDGQGSCIRCAERGKWNRMWMCFLYEIEGINGTYCWECAQKIVRSKMKQDIDKIIEKFNIVLKNYEIDKKFGQITPDSIYSLWPNEMEKLIEYIHYLEKDNKRLRQKLNILSIRPEFNSQQTKKI